MHQVVIHSVIYNSRKLSKDNLNRKMFKQTTLYCVAIKKSCV